MVAVPVGSAAVRRLSTARTAAILALILVFAVALDLFFFTGFYGSDDDEYLTAAWSVYVHGQFHEEAGFGAERLTLLGWNVLAGSICGFNFQAIAATYVLMHLALCVACFLLARHWFGGPAGLLAAYGVGTLPVMIIYSTFVSPDTLLAVFFVLALFAFTRGAKARQANQRWRALLWMAGAGVAVGLGYLTKSPALILLPFFFVYWLVCERKEPKRGAIARGAAFAACFFAVVAIESVTLNLLHDEASFRLDWAARSASSETRAKVASYGSTPWERLQWVGRRYSSQYVPPGFKLALLAAVALFPLVCRRGLSIWWLALWTFAYLTWGTMRLTEYIPPSIQTRYYIPVAALGVIILAAVAMRLREWLVAAGRYVGLGRVLRGATLLALLAYPLLGLHGPDGVAGRLYYAWCVRGADRAIEHASRNSARPIAVSPILSSRVVNPVLLDGFHATIRSYPHLGHPAVTNALLNAERFYYALVEPRYLRNESSYALERALQALVAIDQDIIYMRDDLIALEPVLSVDRLIAHSVRCGDYRLYSHALIRFFAPRSRLAEFSATNLGFDLGWPAARRGRSKAVTLVDVLAVRPAMRSGADGAGQKLALHPEVWQVWRAPGHTLRCTDDGGLRVEWDEAKEEYLWLLPGKSTPADDVDIEPRERAELVVDVAMSEDVSAELILKGVVAGIGDSRAARLQCSLSQGVNRVRVPLSLSPRQITPLFRVMGAGSLVLRELSLRRTKCDDVQDVLSASPASRSASLLRTLRPANLAPNRTYELALVVKLESPGAHLVITVLDEKRSARFPILQKRVRLKAGLNRILAQTGSSDRSVSMYIDEREPGDVSVLECHVTALGPLP